MNADSSQILKFIYSEKAKKFCEISTVDWTVTTYDQSTVEIMQTFVSFSEYMNFKTTLGRPVIIAFQLETNHKTMLSNKGLHSG